MGSYRISFLLGTLPSRFKGEVHWAPSVAHKRNVKIIWEFNMPAHAWAAVMAIEAKSYWPDDLTYLLTIQFYRKSFINLCLNSSLHFVEKLVAEVKLMHDIPLDKYHFGGNEVKNILLGASFLSVAEQMKQQPFSKSPACRSRWLRILCLTLKRLPTTGQMVCKKLLSWEDSLFGTTKAQ